jgi:hypothetical protein
LLLHGAKGYSWGQQLAAKSFLHDVNSRCLLSLLHGVIAEEGRRWLAATAAQLCAVALVATHFAVMWLWRTVRGGWVILLLEMMFHDLDGTAVVICKCWLCCVGKAGHVRYKCTTQLTVVGDAGPAKRVA